MGKTKCSTVAGIICTKVQGKKYLFFVICIWVIFTEHLKYNVFTFAFIFMNYWQFLGAFFFNKDDTESEINVEETDDDDNDVDVESVSDHVSVLYNKGTNLTFMRI